MAYETTSIGRIKMRQGNSMNLQSSKCMTEIRNYNKISNTSTMKMSGEIG